MQQHDNATLLQNFLHIQKAAAESEDGKRCLIPPHPELKKKLVKELDRLKKESRNNIVGRQLSLEPDVKAGFNDGLIRPGNTMALGAPLRVARSQALDAQPLRGTLQVLVVLVEFPDKAMSTPAANFSDLFFSTGKIPTGSVNEYYMEVTNNLINIQGQVVGPYMMPNAITYYANGASGTDREAPNARNMASDAANAVVNAGINLAPFDNNRDGYIDAFIVIHAGTGAEVSGSVNDIWSHKWVLSGDPVPAAGAPQIYGYLTVPEDCRLGVCAHELGHLLFGFPDLYDATYASNGIGEWCLMSGGSWNNDGLTPAHPSAWCKCNQNWVKTIVPTHNLTKEVIRDVKTSFEVYQLWKNGNPATEYFLAENRQRTGFDSYLPGSGLLVWHIDDSIAENTNPFHYKVALEQADGRRDLEKLPAPSTGGDGGDPYPGSTANTAINDTTIPSTLSYGGLSTSVKINNITVQGADIIADIVVT